MSFPSNEPTVLIVDPLPLRNLGLIAIFSRLSGPEQFRFTSLTPDHAEEWVDAAANRSMIIYSVGGASLADHKQQKQIRALRARAADVPLVIFSDNNSREEIFSALSVGAQGFLHSGMDVELARQALSFILCGGSYFPAVNPLKLRRPTPPAGNVGCTAADHGESIAANDSDSAPLPRADLTERQRSVLERLGRGDSNKAIARRLGIREGTVKVHVRQIMRKLGVVNRTQVAIISALAAVHVAPANEPHIRDKVELAEVSQSSAGSDPPWPTTESEPVTTVSRRHRYGGPSQG